MNIFGACSFFLLVFSVNSRRVQSRRVKGSTGNLETNTNLEDNSHLEAESLHIPHQHIASNIAYHGLAEEIGTFPQRRPRTFNVILATCKTWMADISVQFLEARGTTSWRFDWRRNIFFAAFGLLYIGLLQWVLYVSILTWVFPNAMVFANEPWAVKLRDTTGQIDMVGQVMIDQFIFSIFIYFPTFYIFKAVMLRLCRPHNADSLPTSNNCVQAGLSEYWKNGATDLLANWAVWIPADVLIFAVPMYLRMPFEHAVSFGWSMFMSATRGSTVQSETKVGVPGKAGTPRACETQSEAY